ncbi:hypothetical protein ACFWH1_18750 [Streptomyces sp. NPDC127037]|uniref:hypothetical protein n=1 Tax=Streptomyces sp. NPDC127037 TaxID=3347113 RepID=UPI00365CE59F
MSIDPTTLPRLFHGGVPGLNPGDLIEPGGHRTVAGCPVCEARAAGENYAVPGLGVIDPPTQRPDRVYVTADRNYGRFYASLAYRGDLYVVEPVGDVEVSMEDRFPTWCAPAARVRSVYTRCVTLTPGQRRSLLRRWRAADIAALAARAEEAALPEGGRA